MTATEYCDDILTLATQDQTPLVQNHRDAVCKAIRKAVDGKAIPKFSAVDVRPHLPQWVTANMIGNTFSALSRQKIIRRVPGETAESGNAAQRNTHRLMPVYRLLDPDIGK